MITLSLLTLYTLLITIGDKPKYIQQYSYPSKGTKVKQTVLGYSGYVQR